MIDNKPRSKVVLDELRAETNEGNEVSILVNMLVHQQLFVHRIKGSLVVVGGL